MTSEIKQIAVLYHADCPDGFGSAWAAWKKFGEDALYFPVHHRKPPPPEIEGCEVYTLDICYTSPVVEEMLKRIKRLVVVDHHATSVDAIPLATESLYDTSHSGSVLSWKYFHPDEEMPQLLRYIEDIDLWKFAMPNSLEITQALSMYKYDFELWNKIAADFEQPKRRLKYIADGELLVRKMRKLVDDAVANAEEVEFEGYRCLMANSPFHTSEIGAALVAKLPPIGIIWSRRKDRVVVGLRSDGTVDVSKLAQKYGGGGHPAAAAFSWDEKSFLKFRKSVV